MKNLIILIIISQIAICCKPIENTGDTRTDTYVKELISKICEKELISKTENEIYFHVKIEEINDNYYLLKISFNKIQPKRYSYKINYSGFDIYVYSSKIDADEKLDKSAFFVPDSRDWNFLLYTNKEEILSIKQLVNYNEIENAKPTDLKF